MTRRDALLFSASAGLGLSLPKSTVASDSIKTGSHLDPGVSTTPASAVAKTQYGKVRGFVSGGVYTFKGVPYGQDTGGENRWLPLKPPTPWKDEYPALVYGANCPQTLHSFKSAEMSFLYDWNDGWLSEDMLKLNIWTPALTGKRPVMVYLHGGGYSFGSAYELLRMRARRWRGTMMWCRFRSTIAEHSGVSDASEIGSPMACRASADATMCSAWSS